MYWKENNKDVISSNTASLEAWGAGVTFYFIHAYMEWHNIQSVQKGYTVESKSSPVHKPTYLEATQLQFWSIVINIIFKINI